MFISLYCHSPSVLHQAVRSNMLLECKTENEYKLNQQLNQTALKSPVMLAFIYLFIFLLSMINSYRDINYCIIETTYEDFVAFE